ncbi:MAG: hypothetical protein AB2448_01835 [Moorella sp. (in: firmicutes)]
MNEILSSIFGKKNIREEIIPDRGMITVTIGEDDDGLIAAYEAENDDGEFIVHLENIISYRSGHGSELLSGLIAQCREAGYAAIEAIVFPLNDVPHFWHYHRLLRWYEKFGFEYAEPEDAEAAEEILSQPGEIRLDKYEKELRHPRMVLQLKKEED